MNDLERRLVALGEEIAYPLTPDFELELAPARARAAFRRLALAVLLVAAAALIGVLALSPAARSAFREVFHIRGATVVRIDRLPQVAVRSPDLGERVTRAEAERRVGFTLAELGAPDAIFVRGDRIVSLVYGPVARPRLVLSEQRGAVWEGLVKKAGGGGTRIDEVDVDGEPALFVSGDPHVVMFRDARGAIAYESTALAGTVLLWNRGPLLFRLEADATLAEALALAHEVE